MLIFITDNEFVYRDRYGGITLYNAENLTTKILMTNSTFVSGFLFFFPVIIFT